MPLVSIADGYKLIFKDYNITSDRALSVGVCSYSNRKDSLEVGGYYNLTFLSFFDDHLRLGAGMLMATSDTHYPNLALETSVTTLLFDYIEVGAYYAPFYNLMRGEDSPYGVMLGYAIKF
jgi:hypothetical protein